MDRYGKKEGTDRTSEDTFKEIATATSILDGSKRLLGDMEDVMKMRGYMPKGDRDGWNRFLVSLYVSMGAVALRAAANISSLKDDTGAEDVLPIRLVHKGLASGNKEVTAALITLEDMLGISHALKLSDEEMDKYRGMADGTFLGMTLDRESLRRNTKKFLDDDDDDDDDDVIECVEKDPGDDGDDEYRIVE